MMDNRLARSDPLVPRSRRALYLLTTALALFLAPVAGAADFLGGARDKFESETRKLDEALAAKEAEAGRRYIAILKAMISHMERTGDEYGVRPAQAEIERFEKELTIPVEPALGTPELIANAQASYHKHLAEAGGKTGGQKEELAAKYMNFLLGLQQKLKTSSKTAEEAVVAGEIERVSSLRAGVDEAAVSQTLSLPRNVASSLILAYIFEEEAGREIQDQSGGNRHGDLVGAEKINDPEEGTAYLFADDNDILEIQSYTPSVYWTLVARVRFPLAKSNRAKVLVSSAYRSHHVVVDDTGMLGVQDGEFFGSGYNVRSLRGWHELGMVSSPKKTVFYIDGQPVGACGAACTAPVTAFGNSAAGGRPWTGALASLIVWRGASPNEEMARIFQHRYPEAGKP